jgi:hypothetical protein
MYGLKPVPFNNQSFSAASKARELSTIYGTAEAVPFLKTEFSLRLFGPTQGDGKKLLFSNYCSWKHRPFLCHLDRS